MGVRTLRPSLNQLRKKLDRVFKSSGLDAGSRQIVMSLPVVRFDGYNMPPADEPGLGRLDAALDQAVAALAVEKKIRDAVRAGRLDKAPGDEMLESAVAAGIINAEERQEVLDADVIRDEVIQVDAFDPETFRALRG